MSSTDASSSTPAGLYEWCDIAEVAAAQRKAFSRKINATSSLASKALKKTKKQQAMPSSRTVFRQQHEAMQRRHSSFLKSSTSSSSSSSILSAAASRFEAHMNAAATAFAPQLPRLL